MIDYSKLFNFSKILRSPENELKYQTFMRGITFSRTVGLK